MNARTADLGTSVKPYDRSLLAANLSPATVQINLSPARHFGAFLETRGMPLMVAQTVRARVESRCVTGLLGRSATSARQAADLL